MLVAASAWASRIITAITGLFTIRLLMQSLGAEQYAVYAVLGGIQGWFMLADMGVASSLQNFVSERRAKNQDYQEYIASAGMYSILIGGAFLLLLAVVASPLALVILKGFSFLSETDKAQSFFVVGIISIMTCIGGVAYRIWYAEQKGYLANIFPAVASLLSLAGIMFAAKLSADNRLFWSLTAAYSPPAALSIMAFARQFLASIKMAPAISKEVVWHLARRGLKFWGFALMSTGVLQVDYLVMSQFLEPRQIVIYNFTTKIYALVFFVYGAVLSAVWPVCAEAVSREDWALVKRYIKKYSVMGIALIAGFTVFLIFFMPVVVNLLAPRELITVPVLFLLLVGSYQVLRVWTDTFGMVLQSMSYLRPFWLYIPFQVAINLLLQWFLVPRLGVYGVIFGLIGSFAATAVWALPWSFYNRMKKADGGACIP